MDEMKEQGRLCKQASYQLAQLSDAKKNEALMRMADLLWEQRESIFQANRKDVEAARTGGRNESFIDRLSLDEQRLAGICEGIRQVAALADPCGKILAQWDRGDLHLIKRSVPFGVIGIIYEARPNVSVDAAALCLKSGNACYLRGSRETFASNQMLVHWMREALKNCGIDANGIALVQDVSHEAADAFMKMREYLDLLIPRGSARLIAHCVEHARVPIIETGSGNCILYIDKAVNKEQVIPILINAKCQRVSVCNAAESLLIHRDRLDLVADILQALKEHGVKVHGDATICQYDPDVILANEEDYAKEYLDYEISIKCVDSIEEAIAHINTHHTMHSDAILSEDPKAVETFLNEVDAAVVYANASTRFSDGFEFGFGAEIGISTQKLHARGPMGLSELTTYKYQVYGKGSIRK